MKLGTPTIRALGIYRDWLIAETAKTPIPQRWGTDEYRQLAKLESFMAEYFEPGWDKAS